MSSASNMDFQVPCPSCGRPIKKRLGQLRKGTTIRCPRCGQNIQIADRGFEKVRKSLDDFERQLKRTFK